MPVDIATLAADTYEDAWQAMAEAYAEAATLLVAVIQRTGPVTVPAGYPERAASLVVLTQPLPSGAWRVNVIPREETGVDTSGDAERVRERWRRQYQRVPDESTGKEERRA